METNNFLHKLGVHLKTESGDPRAYHFLLQLIAVAIQRGNGAAMLGSSSVSDNHIKKKDYFVICIIATVSIVTVISASYYYIIIVHPIYIYFCLVINL